jgi:hypothetical protein
MELPQHPQLRVVPHSPNGMTSGSDLQQPVCGGAAAGNIMACLSGNARKP